MNDLTIIGPFVVGVVVLLGLGRLIENVLGIQKHGSEPPFIPSKVPYFSHLYFIIRRGVSYYAILTYVFPSSKFTSTKTPADMLTIQRPVPKEDLQSCYARGPPIRCQFTRTNWDNTKSAKSTVLLVHRGLAH